MRRTMTKAFWCNLIQFPASVESNLVKVPSLVMSLCYKEWGQSALSVCTWNTVGIRMCISIVNVFKVFWLRFDVIVSFQFV